MKLRLLPIRWPTRATPLTASSKSGWMQTTSSSVAAACNRSNPSAKEISVELRRNVHTHTHKLPHVATRWQPRKNTKEEAVIEETLWLGRGFIQGHKVSIIFLLLYLCVCVAKIQWQRNNLKKKYDSFKVRLRQVALVHRVCRHEIGHATSEKEVGKFHELVEHSLLFFPMAFVCCDTCTALEVLFFLFTLAFLLPFGFLPFWLLFSTSFHLLLCFYRFFLPSFFNTHATSFYFSLGLLYRPSSTKKKERYQEENTSKKVVYLCVCCCCWK